MATDAFPISSRYLKAMFSLIDEAFCVCELILDGSGAPANYRFIEVNEHFEGMTGLRDAVGRTALELVPDLERHWIDTYADVALNHEPKQFAAGSDAMGRWFEVFAIPVEPHGHFALMFRDTTLLKQSEIGRAKALEHAENLLKELNHRVMNSLGMITSIIGLEARLQIDPESQRAFERIRDRVSAMADLYRCLNAGASVSSVEADAYIGAVVSSLRDSLNGRASVTIRSEINAVSLSTRTAIPLGLIVSELVTNSLKYAFAAECPGVIDVTFRAVGDDCRLVISDTGRGIQDAPPSGSGVGRRLVQAFVAQLDGDVATSSGPSGTEITVRFRNEPAGV